MRRRLNPLNWFKPVGLQGEIIKEVFEDKTANTIFVCGSNRSGKTEVGAYIANEWAVRYPKSRIWLSAETFSDSVNLQQRKVYSLLPITHAKYAYYDEINGFRNRKLLYKNKSRIEFKSFDQRREGFQGDDIDLIINDEEPPYDIVKEQRMRLIDRNGIMVFTMTPMKGVTDLIEDLYDEHDVIRSEYAPLVGEELPRIARKGRTIFFSLWSSENHHINRARLVEESKFMTKEEKKARLYGIPANISGKIYPKFNKDIHVIEPADIPRTKVALYHVLDPHDRKPWAMQWWAVHITGTAYCIYEYPFMRNFNEMEYDDKTYDDYVKEIKRVELDLTRWFGRSVSRRIIDPNFGNKTMQLAERVSGQSKTTPVIELRKRGLHFRDGIDALEAGHLQVRKWMHWEKKGNEFTVRPKMYVSSECENTIRHLSRYNRKDVLTSDGDVKDKVGVRDKWKDYSDLVRYFLMHNPTYVPRHKPQQQEAERVY